MSRYDTKIIKVTLQSILILSLNHTWCFYELTRQGFQEEMIIVKHFSDAIFNESRTIDKLFCKLRSVSAVTCHDK